MTLPELLQTVGGAAGLAALGKVAIDHLNARTTAKVNLQKIAHEVGGEMLAKAHARLDALESRNDKLVTDLADKHEKLMRAERERIDTERALLVAETEGHRKEREIMRLKTKIAQLEHTIEELQSQIEALTKALQNCTGQVTPPEAQH